MSAIGAVEALRQSNARLTDEEIEQFHTAVEKVSNYVREHMTFAGVIAPFTKPLEIPHRLLSSANAVKAVSFTFIKKKWDIKFDLMSEMPRFQGGQPIPHHWIVTLWPTAAAYDEAEVLPAERTSNLLVP